MQEEGVSHAFIEAQGSLHITSDDSFTVSLTNADTYYTLTGMTEGTTRMVTVDADAGTFTVEIPGRYLFNAFASVDPSAAADIYADLHINGTAVGVPSHVGFKNSQDTKTFSGCGILSLSKGDILTMRVQSDTAGITLSIPAYNMIICRVGAY